MSIFLAGLAVGSLIGSLAMYFYSERQPKREWVRRKADGETGYVVERHSEGFVVCWPKCYNAERFFRWNQAFLEFADDWLHDEAKARIEANKESAPTKDGARGDL